MSGEAEIYTRARQMMGESQAAIDALSAFMSQRAALEDSYSKSLAKLSKSCLAINGARDAGMLDPTDAVSGRWRPRCCLLLATTTLCP